MNFETRTLRPVARAKARHGADLLTSLKARLRLAPPMPDKVRTAIASGQLRVLFHEQWYLKHNPDVAAAGVDPWEHFIRHGLHEQRPCHPLFDVQTYLAASPDLAASGCSVVLHYLQYGWLESRPPHPYFDSAWYGSRYGAEVQGLPPLIHYLARGARQGYDPNPFFDTGWYAARHQLDGQSALEHFVTEGRAAGLAPHPFWDEKLYRQSNPDVSRLIDERRLQSGFDHFIKEGSAELGAPDDLRTRRLSIWLGDDLVDFDEQLYRLDNVDVEIGIRAGLWRSGLEHLFQRGWREIESGERTLYVSDRRPRLLGRQRGNAVRGRRHACLFTHYDRDELIDDYVVAYVRALQACDVDIWFITTTMDANQLAKISDFVVEIIFKNNVGRDFASWCVAWYAEQSEIFKIYEYLILANDSVYFPLSTPEGPFRAAKAFRYNMWGITDSYDWSYSQYHLQSYFLGLDRKAREQLLPEVMARVRRRPVLSKRGQVLEFEIALSQLALASDLSIGAFCAIDDIREDAIRDPRLRRWRSQLQFGLQGVDPTLDLWDLIILYYSCPMLKVGLLRDNPRRSETLAEWRHTVGTSWLPPDLIAGHQDRMAVQGSVRGARVPAGSSARVGAEVAVRAVVSGRGFGRGRDLVLFAHYDPQGRVDPHVLNTLRGLVAAECDVAVITATDDSREIRKFNEIAAATIIKSPEGRDFGSWSAGISVLSEEMQQYESVLWVNDSIYYPLFDPAEMFERMRSRELDFWGVTESFNIRWHVMSSFWSFSRRVGRDGWFDWFQREHNPNYTKWAQLRNYETRIPGMLKSKGYSSGSYITVSDVLDYLDKHHPTDPRNTGRLDFTMTHIFWEVLLEGLRCPALKVELVRDNPLGMDLSLLYDSVARHTDYDPELIRNHVRRIKAPAIR